MSSDTILGPVKTIAIPSPATLGRLFAGGVAGLLAWEIWSRTVTTWVLGYPLPPPELVISLGKAWAGYEIPYPAAVVVHCFLGIVGYPVLYYLVSRGLRRWGIVLDAIVWGAFTLYVAYAALTDATTTWMVVFWLIVTAVTATRFVNRNALVADCLSWGAFTWFNALGIFAPLAGLPFLLMAWDGSLSFMSYTGHIVFGFTAAYVFERWQRARG